MASGDVTTDRSGGSTSTGPGTTIASGGSPSKASRFARWLAGWRVAIRIARRDATRYKWRSALIVVMVGLPVLLLTGGITLMATKSVSMAESIPSVMGSAQARITGTSAGIQSLRMVQTPDGQFSNTSSDGTAALTVPGFAPNSGSTADLVQKVTGGRVITIFSTWMRVTQGDRRPRMPVLGIDARDPLARGMAELVSGRWASSTTEVVVTEAGIAHGLTPTGTVTNAGPDGTSRQLTVVGVAIGQPQSGQLPYLIGLPVLVADVSEDRPPSGFLVERDEPVTWSDVRLLNDYGLLVQSRAVFLNPPPAAQLDPRLAQMVSSSQRNTDLILLLAAVGLFIETTLLAGPAFAVSAARQRRSLALAASNGAEARHLRRFVLGQAVVLGLVSAAIAVVAGVLMTLVGLTWWQSSHADFFTGPFEVSWPRVAGVFICAIVASVLAALLPAKGIARLDILSILAGRSRDRVVRRGLPAAGVAVMVLAGSALIWGAAGREGAIGLREYLIVIGAVGLVLGCLMVIPALLALVGRLGTNLVLPMRMATRDMARQRGRSTPAVAAIMAAVAVLTTLSIAEASYERKGEDAYQPATTMGAGIITMGGPASNERDVRSVTDRYAPQLAVQPVGYVGKASARPADPSEVWWFTPVPRTCTEAQALAAWQPVGDASSCESLASADSSVQVGALSSLAAILRLSTSQQAVLEGGGALVTDPRFVLDGKASYISGKAIKDHSGTLTGARITQRTSLPAVLVSSPMMTTRRGTFSTWILPDTAIRLGWPVQTTSLDVTSPTGTISVAEQSAVADRLGNDYSMYVERGYQNPYVPILLILFAVTGLLVLVASLISTALSLAESQNDMATLAAVGATRHTRRGIAAAQALVVAACGCLLGVAVGMVPGIASTWPLTVRTIMAGEQNNFVTGLTAPVIVIPWLPLIGLILLVPLIAGAVAWLAIRRHPQMTRRLA